MSVYGEVARLAAAFPSPKWDMDRTDVFVSALGGLDGEDVRLGVDEILRSWTERFPPNPGQVREVCEVYRRLRMQDTAATERERERAEREHTAPAWVGRFWIGVFMATAIRRGRMRRDEVPGRFGPYVDAVDGEDLVWSVPGWGEDEVTAGLARAEGIFAAQGEKDTQELREREARAFVASVGGGEDQDRP